MKLEIKAYTSAPYSSVFARIEIPDEDMKNMDDEEKEEYIEKAVMDHVIMDMINWTWKEVPKEE